MQDALGLPVVIQLHDDENYLKEGQWDDDSKIDNMELLMCHHRAGAILAPGQRHNRELSRSHCRCVTLWLAGSTRLRPSSSRIWTTQITFTRTSCVFGSLSRTRPLRQCLAKNKTSENGSPPRQITDTCFCGALSVDLSDFRLIPGWRHHWRHAHLFWRMSQECSLLDAPQAVIFHAVVADAEVSCCFLPHAERGSGSGAHPYPCRSAVSNISPAVPASSRKLFYY